MGRDRLLRDHLRDRFIVTLDTGAAFSGLLDKWDHNTVELVGAVALSDGQPKVSGSLLLPRARILYMQHPST
jgi:hypothetical protein